MAYGEDLCVVWEYDGAGRLGSDVVNVAYPSVGVEGLPHSANVVLKTASWVLGGGNIASGNVVLEFTDGTFGTLEASMIASAFSSTTFNLGSAADEIAMPFTVPVPLQIDGLRTIVAPAAATSNFDLVLYEGTTALQTVSFDGNAVAASGGRVAYGRSLNNPRDWNTVLRGAETQTRTM